MKIIIKKLFLILGFLLTVVPLPVIRAEFPFSCKESAALVLTGFILYPRLEPKISLIKSAVECAFLRGSGRLAGWSTQLEANKIHFAEKRVTGYLFLASAALRFVDTLSFVIKTISGCYQTKPTVSDSFCASYVSKNVRSSL